MKFLLLELSNCFFIGPFKTQYFSSVFFFKEAFVHIPINNLKNKPKQNKALSNGNKVEECPKCGLTLKHIQNNSF